MNGIKQKLLKEENSLMNNINKLHEFIHSDEFKSVEKCQQKLLKKQMKAMIKYNKILCMRIAKLDNTEDGEA